MARPSTSHAEVDVARTSTTPVLQAQTVHPSHNSDQHVQVLHQNEQCSSAAREVHTAHEEHWLIPHVCTLHQSWQVADDGATSVSTCNSLDVGHGCEKCVPRSARVISTPNFMLMPFVTLAEK